MEIDCNSEKKLAELLNIFDINPEKIRYGSYTTLYKEYYNLDPDFVNKVKSLTFKNYKKELNL
jgi:hypothetical protein